MPRRKVQFRAGECYHVYNRGHNRDLIFFEQDHYYLFLRKLREFVIGDPTSDPAVLVVAYCLMPNHYHLLVQLVEEDFSRRMQLFGQAYVNAINRRLKRVGGLFQGPFEAKHVDEAEYLVYLTRYIHRNPDAAGLVASPAQWVYSSYLDYLGLRKGTLPSTERILREFGSRQAYRRFVEGTVVAPRGMEEYLFDE